MHKDETWGGLPKSGPVKNPRGVERGEGETEGPYLQHTGSHKAEIERDWNSLSILRETGSKAVQGASVDVRTLTRLFRRNGLFSVCFRGLHPNLDSPRASACLI